MNLRRRFAFSSWIRGLRLAILVSLGWFAVAAPTAFAKVLVLRFDGSDAAHAQSAVVAELSRSGHDVASGDTSFDDSAMLIGCDASSEPCAREILSTLSVDEIVYGSMHPDGVIVVQRISLSRPPRKAEVVIRPGQSLEAALAPVMRKLFDDRSVDLTATLPTNLPSTAFDGNGDNRPGPVRSHRASVIAWSASGALVIAGLMFWVHASSLQDDIDVAPDTSTNERLALADLQRRAATASDRGTVMVGAGAVVAGLGTYFWIRNHRRIASPRTAIRPTIVPGGVGVVVTINSLP